MRKELQPTRPLVSVSLGDLKYVQALREEGHAMEYETFSQYLRDLIKEGRKVLAPKPKKRIRKVK